MITDKLNPNIGEQRVAKDRVHVDLLLCKQRCCFQGRWYIQGINNFHTILCLGKGHCVQLPLAELAILFHDGKQGGVSFNALFEELSGRDGDLASRGCRRVSGRSANQWSERSRGHRV